MAKKPKSREDIVNVLSSSGLGIDMTVEELDQIAVLAREEEFKRNARILEEGSKSRDIYMILQGEVLVLLDIPATYKFEEQVDRIKTNQIFGEFAFLSGEPRSASIQAKTKVTLLLFKYDDLLNLFASNPVIGYKFTRNVGVIVSQRVLEQQRRVRKMLFNNY